MERVGNYIDGRWREPADGRWLDVTDPATGEVVAQAAASGPEDAARAVAAAARAFDEGVWAHRAERDRAAVLLHLAERIRREREDLARLESRDSGKPYADALADVDESAYLFEYYAGWITKLAGEIPPVGPHAMSLVLREPVGVAALITPWNYPLLMAAQKVAPALAAGCSVIVKPAEQTPLTTARLVTLAEAVGIPPGVLNLVNGYGPDAGEPLVQSDAVDMVSFTGSLEVGRHIQRVAAETVKRVTLELGGKSPNIVFDDADVDRAVAGTCFGVFWNQGEVCSAGSRVFVQRTIWDRFMEGVNAYVEQIRLGRGLDPDVNMGPLISREHLTKVRELVASGLQEGARVAIRGRRPEQPELQDGYFHEPLVLTDVDPRMRIMREEIFGPVMSVMPFDDPEEAVRLANDTPYGLAAAVWTRDIGRALKMARRLRAGTVWLNDSQPAPSEAPWGGYKQSGVGRELGRQGLEEFLETKHVYINLS
jgi:betaine-aldehyde dehydrogenase